MQNNDMRMGEKDLGNGKGILKQALHLTTPAIALSFLVTPVRYLLELSGLPEYAIFLIGLLWLTLAFSVFWGLKLYTEKHPYFLLLISLTIFSPISRITVVIAWWIDTTWEIGTHYGQYFDNWPQALLNQGIYGALVQIIPGFALGSITIAVMRHRKLASEKMNSTED